MWPKSLSIHLSLFLILVGIPSHGVEPKAEKWVVDYAAIELDTSKPLAVKAEEVRATGLWLLRKLPPEVGASLWDGERGHCLATGRVPMQGDRSTLNLRLRNDQFSYLQGDSDGQLWSAVVNAPEEVMITLSPAGEPKKEEGRQTLRLQVVVRRAVGGSPVAGLPGLPAGPPIMGEQQTDLTLPLNPGEEVLLFLGMDGAESSRIGLLLRLTEAQQPAYSVPKLLRKHRPILQRWVAAEADPAARSSPKAAEAAEWRLPIQVGAAPLGVEVAEWQPPVQAAPAEPLPAAADPLPAVLAKVLPAVVKINVEQPGNPPRIINQFRDGDFFINPGQDGRMRFRFQGPGQQQEFEFRLPPGQNWQQWLQQNPQWRNWLRQFWGENPNGFFQNNANDAGKKPPRVLQVQPPEEEKPNPPPPPPPPVPFPEVRLEFPPQGGIVLGPPFARGFGETLFAQELAGCIIRPEGYIVTAPGTMLRRAGKIQVTLHDGRAFEAQLVGVDEISDLAVLKVEAEGLPTVQWGDSDQVQVGESIFSIGHPYGYENTVSRGIISGRNRRLRQGREQTRGLLQIDTPLAPGTSGGPVINAQGQVIGLNYAVFRPAGLGAPLSFALPSNTVARVAEQLIDKGRVERAWLGVAVGEINEEKRAALKLPEAAGALVQEVMAGSPAEAAGVQVFDVIRQVGGRPIRAADDLIEAIQSHQPGKEVELKLLRQGEEQTLTVKLGQSPPPEKPLQDQIQVVPGGEEEGIVRQPLPPDNRITRRFQLQVKVRDGRVQLKATNAPLQEVIRRLSAATGTRIAVDPAALNRRITVQIDDRPLNEALKRLTELHGLVLEQVGEWQIIRPPQQ